MDIKENAKVCYGTLEVENGLNVKRFYLSMANLLVHKGLKWFLFTYVYY